MGAVVSGWGISVPEKVVTNEDLSATLETSDAWIVERTGIKQRHVGGLTSELAIDAGNKALADAGVHPSEVDVLVLATTTPDEIVPATSAAVQKGIGLTKAGAFDLNAACSGFVYGLVVGHGLIELGIQNILLVGSDTLSRITDWDERTVAILVGDGAGACVLRSTAGPGQLLGWDLGTDGSLKSLLYCEHGGYMIMDGKELFRRAVRTVVDSSVTALQRAGLEASDVDLFVPHQANARIIQAVGQRLGIPEDRWVVTIDRYGNTSSASIPLALADALAKGRVSDGSIVLLSGFGGGMTWASAVLRWGG
jgi:3-oxoacyl-[acyl-carrier-protein] synthase III